MSFYVDVQHFKNDHHPRLTIKVFHNKRLRSTRDTVRPAGSRLANFYGLLKTHKDRLEMRPILSATQTCATFIRPCTGTCMVITLYNIACLFYSYDDSNIPANPAYGVYISQLVRYARICTSKVDFMNRLRRLSLRLRQQGFLTNLLQRTFTKFFNRHSLIVVKYGATLREIGFAIQA